MKNKSFYITTTLPYVNNEPHIGFALEIIRADIIARYKKSQGFDVFFNTGTDEHGLKMFQTAALKNIEVQKYVDERSDEFRKLLKDLNISEDVNFIRTTDSKHIRAAQAFWQRVYDNGFIYKKKYKTKYCIGCESEKTDSELVDGKCPDHPNQEIEIIEEENYFFKFSEFQEKLLAFYNSNPNFVIPDFRFNEMKEFVKRGLNDFSISRLKTKMPWGIAVPNDDEHVMYVWFDALVNYIATLNWPTQEENFDKYWKEGNPTQYCGKDNTRFQSVMWQAMLMAANLPNSHQIVVNGFILGEGGVKMSKSLGNGVSPQEVIENYGTDALRYFVTRELHPFEDSPFSMNKFKELYNANLSNGIGNLVSRIMKMAEDHIQVLEEDEWAKDLPENFQEKIEKFNLQEASNITWALISKLDQKIQETKPFSLIKTDQEAAKKIIRELVIELTQINKMLEIFMPETAEKIKKAISENKKPETPLFERK